MRKLNPLLILLTIVLTIAACKKDDTPQPAVVSSKTLLANVSGKYTLYSFENGVVASTDSATSKWDFGFKLDKMIVNSNASGPGSAYVQVIDGVFDNYATAPADNYKYDTTTTRLAVKGSDWYVYNPTTHMFAPKAGKVFVFKTSNGKYAKMEILTADPTDDNGTVVTPPTMPTKIKYSIRQAVQMNGSVNF